MSRFSSAVQMLAARMSDNMVEHATHMYSQHNYPDDPGRAALAETLNRIHVRRVSRSASCCKLTLTDLLSSAAG